MRTNLNNREKSEINISAKLSTILLFKLVDKYIADGEFDDSAETRQSLLYFAMDAAHIIVENVYEGFDFAGLDLIPSATKNRIRRRKRKKK